MQSFSKLMTDLVARYWQGSADAAVAHPAYSHIGLPNRDLSEQRRCLLHLANITPTRVDDWRYFGQHALPLVLKTWVELANNSMRQFRAKPQEEPILIIDVYIITLCEFTAHAERLGCVSMHVTLPAPCSYNVKVCQGTGQNAGLLSYI